MTDDRQTITAPRAVPPRPPDRLGTASVGRSSASPATARNRGRIAAGVALLAASAVLAVLVYGNLGERTTVLAAAGMIDAGQVIEDRDLRVVQVAADRGVATIPATRRGDVIGRRAAVALVPGALIADAAIAKGTTLPAGTTVIGAVVKPGQYPIGLRQGDAVVVLVAQSGDEPTRPAPGVGALIVSVSSRSGPDGTAISLAVPSEDAPPLARAGAEGRLLLMQPVP